MAFETGVLDKTRLVSNLLMVILLAGNIFFSIQYTENLKIERAKAEDTTEQTRLANARFLKYFVDTVLNTKGTIAFEDRVKLENDLRQIHDEALTKQWEVFVASKDSTAAQETAVKLMSMLAGRAI